MKFDRLARGYDFLEWLTAGNRLQLARVRGLDALADCRRVLSVGEGHGRFADAFSRRFPDTRLDCLEASPAMLAVARRRLQGRRIQPRWLHTTLEAWRPEEKYEAIVTCFFLDCFAPGALAAAIEKLAAWAEPEATWLVVDFALPAAGIARWRAKAIHGLMYWFFRMVTHLPAQRLTPPGPALQAAGFRLAQRWDWEWGLLATEVWVRRRPTPGAGDAGEKGSRKF